jgi:hypothetical protein
VRMQLGIVVGMLITHPSAVTGQATGAEIEKTARDFFRAEAEGRWIDAAHMLDLSHFEGVRRSTIEALRSMASRPPITAKQLMEMQPDMPLAAAEYQVKTMSAASHGYSFLSREFARIPSADSLAATPLDIVAARWLEAKGSRWQEEQALAEARGHSETGCAQLPDSALRQFTIGSSLVSAAILGAAEASDSTGYVVVDFQARHHVGVPVGAPSYPDPSPHVLALRKVAGKWSVVPAMDMPHADGLGGSSVAIYKCSFDKPLPAPAPKK